MKAPSKIEIQVPCGCVVFVVLFAALFYALFGIFNTLTARAHTAPTGWPYDQTCCSNRDCAQLPPGAVQITPEGYVVTVRPEDNSQLVETKVYTIPFKTTGIRISGDQFYHICLNKQTEVFTNEGNKMSGGSWLCFYIPPSGF
jgi:hypothetical protein